DAVSVGYRPVVRDTTRYPFQYTHAVPDTDRKIMLQGLQFFDTMEFRLSHIEHKVQFEDLEAHYMFNPFRDHTFLTVPSCRLKSSIQYVDKATANMEAIDLSFADYLRNTRIIETVQVERKVKPLAIREMEDKFEVSDWFRNSRETYLPQQDPYVIKYSASLKDYLERTFNGVVVVATPGEHTKPKTSSYDTLKEAEGTGISSAQENDTWIPNNTFIRNRFTRIYVNERLCLGEPPPPPLNLQLLDEVLDYDMSWVGMVKVLSGVHGDELAIYVFAPSDVNRDLGRNIQFNKVMGYSPIFEVKNTLYSPENSIPTGRDERQTLYWHALLLKETKDNVLDIEFSNNDFGRGYWITIKGVTADGRLVDITKKIKIDPKKTEIYDRSFF
ncbi:MAG TPA: hypothetical protein PKA53_06250, partial [Sphingobacterium sp.]|nr:hypothetical protein [Sphingobacterium sp.]